jgi:hypothetical protein
MEEMNRIAPDDHFWVCLACGKTSVDKCGLEGEHSRGWDASCMLNSALFPKDALVYNKDGSRVVKVFGSKLDTEELSSDRPDVIEPEVKEQS